MMKTMTGTLHASHDGGSASAIIASRIGAMNPERRPSCLPERVAISGAGRNVGAPMPDSSKARRWVRSFPVLALALACALPLGFTGCTTVPETGRRQLNFLSPDQETQMGLTAFQQMKEEVPISKDAAAAAMVDRVGKRIAAVAPLPNAQWEFVLFESKEPNAFCLPGGKVGVYTGILPYTQDEAGLATVIGHEVAHAVARHGGERVSQQMGLELLGAAVNMSMGDSKWRQAVVSGYGLGTQVGYALPHSRMQESEADEMGLLYMARAGYNPEAAVAFWQRFAELEKQGGGTPYFLRTHPMSDERAQRLRELMPRALQEYQAHGGK